jgi:hypothetical protein
MNCIENDASNNSSILACTRISCRTELVTQPLPSNYRGNFTEPLPSSDTGIHMETHTMIGGIYEVTRA